MHPTKNNLYIGVGLVVLGLVFLLGNLRILYVREEYIVAGIFGSIAAYLFWRFYQNRRVSVLLVAAILAFIVSAILIDSARVADEFVAIVLFWEASALFAYGYFRNVKNWGFLIPAGICLTLGAMVLVDLHPEMDDDLLGGIFFLGLAGTFGFLFLIRDAANKLDWAKYPAAILALFAGFIVMVTTHSRLATTLLPLTLIAIGIYLVQKSTQKRTLQKT